MRVGRRRVAYVWTCAEAPEAVLLVAIGRGEGSCGAVRCDWGAAQARGRNVYGAIGDGGVGCVGTACGHYCERTAPSGEERTLWACLQSAGRSYLMMSSNLCVQW